mgnify:FL=1
MDSRDISRYLATTLGLLLAILSNVLNIDDLEGGTIFELGHDAEASMGAGLLLGIEPLVDALQQ